MSAAEFAEATVERMRAAASAGEARRAAVWNTMDVVQRGIVLRVACIDPSLCWLHWSDLPESAQETVSETVRALVGLVRAFAFRAPACC